MRKLSEIKGDAALETLAMLIDPVADMASDPQVMELFHGKRLEGEDNRTYTLRIVKQHIPYLLKNHKQQLISIFAALEGASAEDYSRKLSILTLPIALVSLLNDPALIELFTSAASTVAQSNAASPAASASPEPKCSCGSAPIASNSSAE